MSQSSASAMAPIAMRLMATAWDEAKSCDSLSQSEVRWTFSWGPAGMPHQWPRLPHSLGILHLGISIRGFLFFFFFWQTVATAKHGGPQHLLSEAVTAIAGGSRRE